MPARANAQLAIDETVIEDAELEALLERRLVAKQDVDELSGPFKKADEAVKGAIAKLSLEDGAAIRVGRFRITRHATPGGVRSFETKPSSRILIDVTD